MSAEAVSDGPQRFSSPTNSETDFATEADRAASHERVAARVKYTDEMLREDTRFAVSFTAAMLANEAALKIGSVARILHDHITPMGEVMDTIDDASLTQNERMKVHLSRLTSARGRTDQNRFATRRQQDRVLAHMDAAEAHMRGIAYDRSVAMLRLVDLRASIDWDSYEQDAWFLRTHHRLAYEADETSTT